MSETGNGEAIPYEVIMSGSTKALLKRLQAKAIQQGRGHQFLTAFRQIAAQLKSDPLTFGEPLYRLPALELQVRQTGIIPIVLEYAVHEQQNLVFIRGIRIMS